MADKRNYDGIQFEKYRKKVDPKFNQLHDELTDCYYNYWKKGLSKPFQGYDKQTTGEESKILFDKLHGMIFIELAIAIDVEHKATLTKDQDPKYEKSIRYDRFDKTGKKIDSVDKIADAQAAKTNLDVSITVT